LKQTKVVEANTLAARVPVAVNGATSKKPVVERKSVCTQTDKLQQGTTETHEPSVTGLTGTHDTVTALLWLIKNLKPSAVQTDIIGKLTTGIQVIGTAGWRSDKHPTAPDVSAENIDHESVTPSAASKLETLCCPNIQHH